MENITHLGNVIKFLVKFNDKCVNDLLIYYTQLCQQQGNTVELPKEYFGPSNICFHCGSLFTRVKHRNRLNPGKFSSNVEKKLIGSMNSDGKFSKFRSSLARKCLRSKMNNMIIKCSACLKNTKFFCKKPTRQKCNEDANLNSIESQIYIKKKRSRSKDKTAGLNLSFSDSFTESLSTLCTPESYKSCSPLRKERKRIEKSMTPLEKLKKMNREKLSNIFKDEKTNKRNSLNNFLKELY